MSKLNHTPGPWKVVSPREEPENWAIDSSSWFSLAVGFNHPKSPGEGESNARLIAAAPEMYKLLRLAATGEQIRIAAGDLIRKLEGGNGVKT